MSYVRHLKVFYFQVASLFKAISEGIKAHLILRNLNSVTRQLLTNWRQAHGGRAVHWWDVKNYRPTGCLIMQLLLLFFTVGRNIPEILIIIIFYCPQV